MDSPIIQLINVVEKELSQLPIGLQEHIYRTRILSRKIAESHGAETEKCDLGASAHDIARHWTENKLITEARRLGLDITEVENDEPLLLHGPIGAHWLRNRLACSDLEIVSAVNYHTTGRPEMSQVEKIVFIADKIEPQKIKKYPELGSIMDIVMDDLDGAILRYLALRIRSILANGGVVHPRALETWNWLILKRNSRQ